MLPGPDRVEGERAGKPHLLHHFGEAADGVVALGLLRVEVDAELHGPGPPAVVGAVLSVVSVDDWAGRCNCGGRRPAACDTGARLLVGENRPFRSGSLGVK